jgi:hypothetical protein
MTVVPKRRLSNDDGGQGEAVKIPIWMRPIAIVLFGILFVGIPSALTGRIDVPHLSGADPKLSLYAKTADGQGYGITFRDQSIFDRVQYEYPEIGAGYEIKLDGVRGTHDEADPRGVFCIWVKSLSDTPSKIDCSRAFKTDRNDFYRPLRTRDQ